MILFFFSLARQPHFSLLLKSIVVKDIENAIKLGVLELAPEDLSLCSYVCPSKYDYCSILDENLELIYKELQ
jgi:Na+-transporting NADH:ubiquinone oxidoreductase subunit A